MKLAYQAFDGAGKAVAAVIDAADEAEAIESLRRQGLFVVEIRPAGGGASPGAGRAGRGGLGAFLRGGSDAAPRIGKGRRLKYLAMFTRQLAVLVSSGTPLVQALSSLERQAKDGPWRRVLTGVRMRVEEGATLSGAMEAYPQVFDPVCRSLIAAGESGGSFDVMLDRLATLCRKQKHVRSAVTGAMLYPILLVFVAVCVLALMLLFVLPRFAILFESLDAPLPPMTKMMMALSRWLQVYWWSLPIAVVAGAVGLRFWAASPAGRRAIDTLVLKLPIFGPVVKNFAVARITRVVGVLVTGRVTLLDALGLARQTVNNIRYVELVASAQEAVTRGSSMSAAFAAAGGLVSPSLCEAVRSGEQSGQMGPLLLNIADFLDEDNEVVIKSLTQILEPLILIVLGVVVGFVALSMFLPLFDLTAAAQG